MRILHVMNSLSDRGNGIVNLAVDLAIEQAHDGHTVAFACGDGGYANLLQKHGIRHYLLRQTPASRRAIPALFSFPRVVSNFVPDIIHAHMRLGLLLSWLWTRRRTPVVLHLHNVHDRFMRLAGLADRIITVSRSVNESLLEKGLPASKLRVVVNGPLNSRRQLSPFMLAPEALKHPAITTVAGMNSRKGIADLLAAFDLIAPQFPKAHLYIVGDGPERSAFEQQAGTSAYSNRIHFEGFQKTPQRYMLASEIFVLASRRESFGLVLSEARQAGCAIVATAVDGIPEALDGGAAGLLVPPRDPAALAGALRMLLEDEQSLRAWRAKASRGVDAYTVKRMANEVEGVYTELTSCLPQRISA